MAWANSTDCTVAIPLTLAFPDDAAEKSDVMKRCLLFFLQRLAVAIREGSQHRPLASVLIAVKLKKDGGIWDGQLRDVLNPKQSEQCTFDASDMMLLPEWANTDMRPTA